MERGYDILGNIAVVKFSKDEKAGAKRKLGEKFLREHKSVTTVVEKSKGFSGRLRLQKTKWIAGEKTKEVLYRENGCVFRFNVDSCYFSPRLSTERAEIASQVKKGESVLVMFGGIAPFAIVIGRLSKAGRIVSIELGRECNRYALENVKRNKMDSVIEVVQGDVRKVLNKSFSARELDSQLKKARVLNVTNSLRSLGTRREKFDRVIMARPNLKDSFLDIGFSAVKKGGVIYYYGFYGEGEVGKLKELIMQEAKKSGRKIRVLGVKRAGEVGVRKFRFRADLKILN